MSIFIDIEKKLGDFFLKVKFEAGNETLALLGPSGCGKSMTLRCIAGIEKPDRGKIIIDGVTVFDSEKRISLDPQARRAGLLFQNYALFPNMTAEQNIRAGAKRTGNTKEQLQMVRQMLEQFELTDAAKLYPGQLSGGQQQRAALARLLVSKPDILMLDEPFSALDSHLRFKTEQAVREVIRQFGRTVLLVSHDREEVFRLSDRVALMHHGRIGTVGEKRKVFRNPETTEEAIVTGYGNIAPVTMTDAETVFAADWGISIKIKQNPEKIKAVAVRSQDIRWGKGENTMRCRVISEEEQPFSWRLVLKPEQGENVLFWETEREFWNNHRQEFIEVFVPDELILHLRG